jgi:hypothetical protein
MATTTPKLGLRKPAGSDLVSVLTDLANNFDIIDNAMVSANATVDGSGQIRALGVDNRFGPGEAGANDSFVGLGKFDAANALIYAGQGAVPDCSLIVQTKGQGSLILRNGGDTSKYLLIDKDGKFTMGVTAGAATAATATAGGSVLPATPMAFWIVAINGANYKIPLYMP